MPTRHIQTHRFAVDEFKARPEAKIVPEEATSILGASITFSAAASTVEEESGEGLTYEWGLSAPDGSALPGVTLVEDDGSVVRIDGDVTGTYILTLKVYNGGVASDAVTAAAFFSPVIVPAVKRLASDGRFMFRVLSNFWSLVNDKEVFPVLWSSYSQAVASDLLQALQIDRAKSIRTIQPLYQKRWIAYKPGLDIDPAQTTMILGNHQSGGGAFTGDITFVDAGILVSPTEFVLLTATTSKAVGSTLTLFEGDNIGEYLINRLNSSGDGYIVSSSDPFPNYAGDIVVSGSTLVYPSTLSSLVYSTTVDFTAANVEAGDVLRIDEGGNTGYYTISKVGTADGLSSDFYLELETSPVSTASDIKFTVFSAVRASYLKDDNALTNTVYIPQDEADLDAYSLTALSSTGGEIKSNFEISVVPHHVIESSLGAEISIKTGARAGTTATIADFNESMTGFIVSVDLGSDSLPEEVSYEITINSDVSNRLLILDGEAHRIAGYELLEGLPSVEEGGRGNLWAVILEDSTAPSKREGIEWRIGSTVTSDEFEDFEAYGVRDGDLLELQVFRPDVDATGTLYARITGASENEFSFEIGTDDLVFGVPGNATVFGEPSAKTLVTFSEDLSVPTVTESSVTSDPIFTSTAIDIRSFVYSTSFTAQFFNIPIESTTRLNIDSYFDIQLKPNRIIRNSRVALDPEREYEDSPVYSIPALYEYISPEQVSKLDTGEYQVATADMFLLSRETEPVGLVENGDYTVARTELSGAAGGTSPGAASIFVGDTDLVANDVRPGDVIVLESGMSQGSYPISAIISSNSLRVGGRDVDASLPIADEAGIIYRIERRVDGNFIRFMREFTPKTPAPETLWAPLTLIDNFKYIEDNFGVLVGVTKAELDEFGTTQVSFKAAISGLMYAWSRGPTFRSAEIGAHILLDLPVTEMRGEILEIDHEYSDGKGRVLLEDVTADGIGKGIYRTYLFTRDDQYNVEQFNGLGINPSTGAQFQEGDVVERYIPLSNSVVISDRIKDPFWWNAYAEVPGSDELQKYHTWQAEFDLKAVDSRDVPLAADFLMKIRPIYTKPKIVGVLALLDEVIVEDDFYLDLDLFLYDDPAFSRESAHMVDSMNDSGASTRILDMSSYGTRTFFRGDDLSVEALDEQTEVVGIGALSTTTFEATLSDAGYEGYHSVSWVHSGGDFVASDEGGIFASADDVSMSGTVDYLTGEITLDLGSSIPDVDTEITITYLPAAKVVSERGGFVKGTEMDGKYELPYINSYFQDPVEVLTEEGVREGDVLFVTTGRNRGRFVISSVISDTELRILEYAGAPPRGVPITHIRSDENAGFHIQRRQAHVIMGGEGLTTTAGSNLVQLEGGTFRSSGVTTQDVLRISHTTGEQEVADIAELGEYDPVSLTFGEDVETKLTLVSPLTVTDEGASFEILRYALNENPVLTGEGDVSAGGNYIDVNEDISVEPVFPGDRLLAVDGDDSGKYFEVIGVSPYEEFTAGNTRIFVERPFSSFVDPILFQVVHRSFEEDEEDSDYRLERLHAYDAVDIDIYRPVTTVLASTDFVLSDDEGTPMPLAIATHGSGTDLATLGVEIGMWLEVEVVDDGGIPAETTSTSHGIYEIVDLINAPSDNDTVVVSSYFPGVIGSWSGSAPVTEISPCRVLTADPNFQVTGDTVTLVSPVLDSSAGATTLEAIGVRPGDQIEIESFDSPITIISVSGSTLTLVLDTGLAEAKTGRIFRRERP